jgi:hypothetical protein
VLDAGRRSARRNPVWTSDEEEAKIDASVIWTSRARV